MRHCNQDNMTLGDLLDSSARPITQSQPANLLSIYSVNISQCGNSVQAPLLSRWTLYFVQTEMKIPQECVVRLVGGAPEVSHLATTNSRGCKTGLPSEKCVFMCVNHI